MGDDERKENITTYYLRAKKRFIGLKAVLIISSMQTV